MHKAPEPIRSWTWPHYELVRTLLPKMWQLLGGWCVAGQEHIPEEGGAVIAPNHVSYFDPPAVGASLPRRTYYFAKKELFAIPVFGWLVRKCYAFPVDREGSDHTAFRHAIRLLQAGELLVVFPEGGRSQDGNLEEGGIGAALIASRAGVPLIPCSVWGTDVVLPRGAWFVHTALVQVSFARPIAFPSLDSQRLNKDQLQQITEQVMAAIAELRGAQEEFTRQSKGNVSQRAGQSTR